MEKKLLISAVTSALIVSNVYANSTLLGEVTVTTATKTEKSIDGVTASVVVITEEEIEKMGAESLKDVISNTSGLTIQYGTFPSASSKSKSSISIRGMSANGTLFLLDGRRLAGEVKNPFDLDRIPASSIERIEIVKGPMSSLYGADAVGGVINIITKKATSKPEIDINIRYGQNADGDAKNKNASFAIRGTKDKFKYSIYANKTKTTPYYQKEDANVLVKAPRTINPADGSKTFQKTTPSSLATPTLPNGNPLPAPLQGVVNGVNYLKNNLNNKYANESVSYREESDITSIGGRFDYEISDSSNIGFDINAFDEERYGSYIGNFHPSKFNMPVFNIPVNSKDENKRIDLGIDFETALTEDLLLKLRAYKSYYKKRNTTTAKYYKEMGYASESESASNGMNANVDIRTYEATLDYALNDNHYIITGAEYRDEKREATVFDNTPDMTEQKVDYKSIFIQDEWQINDSLNAVIGARYDKVSNADNKATLKVGLVNKFSDLLNLRGIFAQGYRTPDIREMYINKQTPNGLQQGASVVGYDLKPEFTNTYELGLSGRSANFSYDVAIFLNDIEDRISQVQKTALTGSYYTFENINEAQTKGLELNLNYRISDNLSTGFNFMELRTKDKNTNKDLEFNPDRTASLSLNYQALPSLNISTVAKYIGKQHYTENAEEKTTKSFTLVDLNLDYKINKNFSVYGGVNNIFDKKVDDVLGSNVGVYYFTGLRMSF